MARSHAACAADAMGSNFPFHPLEEVMAKRVARVLKWGNLSSTNTLAGLPITLSGWSAPMHWTSGASIFRLRCRRDFSSHIVTRFWKNVQDPICHLHIVTLTTDAGPPRLR